MLPWHALNGSFSFNFEEVLLVIAVVHKSFEEPSMCIMRITCKHYYYFVEYLSLVCGKASKLLSLLNADSFSKGEWFPIGVTEWVEVQPAAVEVFLAT